MTSHALLVGFAQILADAGVGVWDVNRTWTDTDTQVAIIVGAVPQDPTQVVVLAHYAVRDDPRFNDSTVGIQIRIRGDDQPQTVQDRNDAIFGLLQGMHDTIVGGVPVVLVSRNSSLPMGPDQNNRLEYSSNFYVEVAWATTYRDE